MIIKTETHVIEIKARYSWDERNSKDALAGVLATTKLAFLEAYLRDKEQGRKYAEEMLEIYKELDSKFEELCPRG